MMNKAEQLSFFEDQGYLIMENLISTEDIADCREEIHRLHSLAAEYEAKADPRSINFQREPNAENINRDDGTPLLRKIENTRVHSSVFNRLSKHPRLIEVVQNLIGPDLLLFRSTLMLKPAFHGSGHEFHQDSAYWPMEPPRLVTVSIALDDANTANSCFKVVPGSHKWGLKMKESTPAGGRIVSGLEVRALVDGVDLSDQIEVPLSAGSILFFHSLIMHGSNPNTSAHSRNTALYAYFSPNVRYVPKEGRPKEQTFVVVAGLDNKEELTLKADPR